MFVQLFFCCQLRSFRLPFQCTAGEGTKAMAYVSLPARHRDIEIRAKRVERSQAGASKDLPVTLGTRPDKRAAGLVVRAVSDLAFIGSSRCPAPEAINFAQCARTPTTLSACPQEVDRVGSKNELRSRTSNRPQTLLDPRHHRIAMKAQFRGELINGVVDVLLKQTMVGMSDTHRQPSHRREATRWQVTTTCRGWLRPAVQASS